MKYFTVFLWVWMIAIPFVVVGQNPLGAPLVVNYGKATFQGGSRTWDIQQDSRGILYFGNNEGLISFDGKYWKQYKLPNQTIVRSIYISEDDKIYVGGQGEFGYFVKSDKSDLRYVSLHDKVPAAYRQFADVWHTVGFEQGIFFMASNLLFVYKGDKVAVYPASLEWQFMGQSAGRLFAQDKSNGLLAFNNGQWNVVSPATHFGGNKISGMLEMGKDSVLVSLLNNRTMLLHHQKLTSLENVSWHDMYTPSIAKIDNNRYVMATATEGCHIRTVHGRLLERISVVEGLQNKNVSTVFVDKQQNIWVAVDNGIAVISYGGGVRYLRPNVDHEVTGYSTRVFENNLYISSSNGVYVASLDKGIEDHSQSPGLFSLVKGSDGGEAWRLDEVNGKLLLAHNKGFYEIEGPTVKPIAPGTGSWLTLPLSSVYPINYSLIGTYQGLNLLGFDGRTFSIKRTLLGTSDSYRFLAKDDNGIIWASHPYRGIYQMKLNAPRTTYKTKLLTQKDGLPSTYQNYVFKIKNRVVFATEKGVYEYDASNNHFFSSSYFAVFRGIPIKYLIDDKEGNIWFCSGKRVGVADYDKERDSYKITYFPEIEGLNTSGFENIYPYDAQNVYIGSEKGVIHINYEMYRPSRTKPTVLLSSVSTIGVKDSVIFGGDSPGSSPILNASFDSFHFEYASPSYGIHEHVSYRYWLEGYDTDWSPWTTNSEKDYTNLPSGQYTFKVKAKNNLNEESEIAVYVFEIEPPWYKTAWAYVVYVVLASLGIYWTVNMQKKAWVKQQLKFEKEMQQMRYIHQLEVEKNEKEIVKLQNEKLENEVLTKTKELASTSMQLMENSGALTKLRVELSKLEATEEGTELRRITSLLKDVENNTAHWDQFATHFDELNDGFFNRLKSRHPSLSRNDLKVCAYLRLNFSTKQIAQLQSISVRGVEIHRYRLRKKLNIDTEISLSDYLERI
ncbi:transcriptional regulator [Sphingobacterium alkalisoli]|uniref:Transcriptional regulator n=1 Tax=Sphingobacterium alkalisoli TaxID=1874115 RepID=A0A4U0H5G1_9SPHI|nr:triple tyrosine motif-containing protein [Sphingobacterium alkalisoli]TJY66971.1 transcriptional regulator [Sphingobacterium alkalisoli]GGH13068.1 hypothetical protein GCM10011418_13010 [Sphingobacterium alkalisoli]